MIGREDMEKGGRREGGKMTGREDTEKDKVMNEGSKTGKACDWGEEEKEGR